MATRNLFELLLSDRCRGVKYRSIDEHAMHNHRESARQRHLGLAEAV